MNTGWAPKPNRPQCENPLFKFVEAPTVSKGLTPMQRQRLEDGTPHTRTGPTDLRPADPELYIRPELAKGSLVANYDKRPQLPKQDPQDPLFVVKSFLEHKDPVAVESDKKMTKSLADMNTAIAAFAARASAKAGS